jgi:hypothetical protein
LPFYKVTESGADPHLRQGEQLVCKPCNSAYDADDTSQLWDQKRRKSRCPNCGAFGQFVKRKARASKSIADRWSPPVAAVGWTPVPEVLIKHQGALGLSASDLAVLLNLELHRREASQKVWPSAATIAKRSGLSERTVRSRFGILAKRGLIEVEPGWRDDGGNSSNRSTALGLRRALDLIAANLSQGLDAGKGLEELLVELGAAKSNNDGGEEPSPAAKSAPGRTRPRGKSRRGPLKKLPPK